MAGTAGRRRSTLMALAVLGPAVPYTFLDHTADVGVEATGDTLEAAFAAGVLGMFAVICDPDVVERAEIKAVRAEGETPERLLFNLLDECIFLHSTENWLAGRVTVKLVEGDEEAGRPWKATATLEGEPLDKARHTELTEVKAPTKHLLEVDRDRPRVQIIFDL